LPTPFSDDSRGQSLERIDNDARSVDVLELLGVGDQVSSHRAAGRDAAADRVTPRGGGPCSAQQRPAQRIESDRTEVQRSTVDHFEIEFRARSGAGFVSDLFPQALTDFVAWGLAGPTEIPIEFEREEGSVHGDVLREEFPRFGAVPDSSAEVGRGFEAEVEADVDDHP